eukprot:3917-Pelagococcus_subviridis.AAC.3
MDGETHGRTYRPLSVSAYSPGVALGQQRVQKHAVFVVRDAPAVVALARGVSQRLPRGNAQVAVVEPVRDVPSQRPELPALLDDGVEEAQTEQERFERLRFRASVEKVQVADGLRAQRLKHVRPDAFRGLVRHLHRVLKDVHREVFRRIRRHPQPEIRVRATAGVVRVAHQLFDDGIQRRHPRRREVAVLQHDPTPRLLPLAYHRRRFRALALPERYVGDAIGHPALVRELKQTRHGVRPRGEDEHERRRRRAVVVAALQTKRWRMRVPLPEVPPHEIPDRGDELIRANAAHEEKLLERRERVLERRRERRRVRRVVVVHRAPRLRVVGDGRGDAFKRGELRDARQLAPALLRDPRRVLFGDVVVVQFRAAGTAGILARAAAYAAGEQETPLLGRPAHVPVQREKEVGLDVLEPGAHVLGSGRGGDGRDEQPDEPPQRVLIHRLDVGEFADGEKQHRGVLSRGFVAPSRGVDLALGLVRDRLRGRDLVRDRLRVRDGLDRGLPSLVPRGSHHEVVLRGLEVRPLFRDDDAQELVPETFRREREIQKRHLHRGLRQVMRVP